MREQLILIATRTYEEIPRWLHYPAKHRTQHLYLTPQPSVDGLTYFETIDLAVHRRWMTDADASAWASRATTKTSHA